jgi:4-hydroxy-2-oxoheptanedioate aldolase
MRTSKTLAKIRAGKPVKMCCLGHFVPAFIRHAAHHGFDCIWLDTEHRTFERRELQSLLAYFHLADIDCMLRVDTRQKIRLYRYLEDGASGLMVPHVSTVEEARELVQSVKFPPLGDRGLDGAGLDSDFILQAGPDFTRQANEQTFLVVQIETPQAVENVDEIAAVEGIDGLFVGPGDLGLRIREWDTDLTVEAAIQRVADVAAKHQLPWGCPAATREVLEQRAAQGAQLLNYGGDFMAMKNMLEANADELAEVYGE